VAGAASWRRPAHPPAPNARFARAQRRPHLGGAVAAPRGQARSRLRS